MGNTRHNNKVIGIIIIMKIVVIIIIIMMMMIIIIMIITISLIFRSTINLWTKGRAFGRKDGTQKRGPSD